MKYSWTRRELLISLGILKKTPKYSRNKSKKLEISLIPGMHYASEPGAVSPLFYVILLLKNTSNTSYNIIRIDNSYGVGSISLKIIDESGIVYHVNKRPGTFRKNLPFPQEMKAGSLIAITLIGDDTWEDLPKKIENFTLYAEFTQTAITDKLLGLDSSKQWIGKAISNSLKIIRSK